MAMEKNLSALIKVVETGNLTMAAEQIGLAQPSLTKRLKQLEEEYDALLFERRPHGMVPTDFGRTLYRHAKRIEQEHLQAIEAIAARKSGHLDILRVGAGPIVRSYLMRSLIEALKKEFSGLRFEFREDVHMRNLPLLRNGDLDVVFGAVSESADMEGIRTYKMATLTLGVLAHESHPLFKRRSVLASDLIEVPWIHHADDGVAGDMIGGYYARHGYTVPPFSIRTTSLEFGMELVASNGYVMPAAAELTGAFQPFGIKALPLTDSIDHFPIGAYVRKSSLAFPAILRLIELAESLAVGGLNR